MNPGRSRLEIGCYGDINVSKRRAGSYRAEAAQWRQRAATLRRDLAHLEALPVSEAAQVIRRRRAEAEAQRLARRADTERQAQFVVPDRDEPRRSEPGRAPGR